MKTQNLFAAIAAALAAAGCEGDVLDVKEPEGIVLTPIEIELTRADERAEYRGWVEDLATLKGPGGADYARTWGMTLPEAKAHAREGIARWSRSLGPWPQNYEGTAAADGSCSGMDDPTCGPAAEAGPGKDEYGDPVPPDEDNGVTCWWFPNDWGYQVDRDGWWVCEAGELGRTLRELVWGS